MGKRDKDEPEDDRDNVRGLAGSQVDADKRRNIVATSRTRSRATSETIDHAALVRAVADVADKATAGQRLSFDGLQRAYLDTMARLDSANAKVVELVGLLQRVAGQNVEMQAAELNARSRDLNSRHKWETIGSVVPQAISALGPGVAPFLSYVAQKFLPALPPPADDKSARAAVLRLVARLQDGSEGSAAVLGVLAEFCGEDMPLVIEFLRGLSFETPVSSTVPESPKVTVKRKKAA